MDILRFLVKFIVNEQMDTKKKTFYLVDSNMEGRTHFTETWWYLEIHF